MKVVINVCYGGFSLSRAAFLRLREMGSTHAMDEPDEGEKYSDGSVRIHQPWDSFLRDIPRASRSSPRRPNAMRTVEIPSDVAWHVDEYDGNEHIAEDHRTWR